MNTDRADVPAPNLKYRLLHRLGLDRAIAFTAAARIGNSLAGLAAIFVVARSLTKSEQGYYFTFNNLLAMQVFFELGLGTVILHAASHEVALLTVDRDGKFVGDEASRRRLADLLQIGAKTYAGIAVLFALIIVPVGLFFFRSDPMSRHILWQLPWIATVVFTGVFLPLSGATSFIEGCGQITDAARVRLWQGVLSNIALLLALLLGAKLFASALGAVVQAVTALAWLTLRHRQKLVDLWRTRPVHGAIEWWTQIWPFQWRVAVSWFSGYLIFQLFTPILFKVQGAEVAGRFGMTVAVVNGISSVSTSWITTKVPRFGSLIALRQFDELDAVFVSSTRMVLGFTAILGAGFWLFVGALRWAHHPLADRFSDGWTIALLVATAVSMNFSFSLASYLRSHKREPFLASSVCLGLANLGMALAVARPFGELGVAAGSLCTSLLIASGVGYWIFVHRRREWHAIAP